MSELVFDVAFIASCVGALAFFDLLQMWFDDDD
jgi:hypothetical protein